MHIYIYNIKYVIFMYNFMYACIILYIDNFIADSTYVHMQSGQ